MIGVEIEGIPGVFGWGELAAPPTGWIAGALATQPQLSTEGVEPETGSISTSRITIELNATATLRRLLLYQAVEPAARLSVDRNATVTALVLSPALPAAAPAGQRLYLNGETMIATGIGSASAPGVTRGGDGSTPRPFLAGDFVYLAPPYWRRRRVTVRSYPAGVAIWRGLLDEPPKTTRDSSRIQLQASGVLVLARDAAQGRARAALPVQRSRFAQSADFGWIPLYGKATPHAGKASPAHLALQVPTGETDYTLVQATRFGTSRRWVWDADRILLGAPALEIDRRPGQRRPAFEVLLVSPLAPDVNPCAAAPYPYHPLTLASALLFSRPETDTAAANRFDLLGPYWSAQLGAFTSQAAYDAITALIERTRDLRVDQVLLGWDNQPYSAIEQARGLAHAWGFVLGSLEDGSLVWRQAPRIPNILEPLPILALQRERVEWEQPRGGSNDNVTVSFGGLPWSPPVQRSISVQAAEGSYPTQGETLALDLSSVSISRADAVASRVLSVALRRFRGAPTLKIRVGPEVTPAIGEVYRLTSPTGLATPIFVRFNGDLTSDLSTDDFCGQCVARRWLVELGAWEVELRLTAWPIGGLLRARAPASVILAVSATQITCAPVDFGQTASTPAAEFRAGEQISIWSPDGVAKSAYAFITSIAAPILNVGTDLTGTAVAGDIVRQVEFPLWTVEPRPYTYLTTPPDRYA